MSDERPSVAPGSADGFARRLLAAFPMVDDHPDVAGVLRDPALLAGLGPALAAPFRDAGITKVITPEARGPIVGALVAVELGAGLVLARKDDRNHPGADLRVTSSPTWRGHEEVFQARTFDLGADDVVLVADDWITTGNSIRAARSIVRSAGARFAGSTVIVDKTDDDSTLTELSTHRLVRFADLVDPGRHRVG